MAPAIINEMYRTKMFYPLNFNTKISIGTIVDLPEVLQISFICMVHSHLAVLRPEAVADDKIAYVYFQLCELRSHTSSC